MNNFEMIKSVTDAICRQAMLIPLEDAIALVNEFEHTHALMPILDPTGYIEIAGNMPGHERMAKAFLVFRKELEEIAQG